MICCNVISISCTSILVWVSLVSSSSFAYNSQLPLSKIVPRGRKSCASDGSSSFGISSTTALPATRAGFLASSPAFVAGIAALCTLGVGPSATNAVDLQSGLDSLNDQAKSLETAATKQAKTTTKQIQKKTAKVTKTVEKETNKVTKKVEKETNRVTKRVEKETKKVKKEFKKEAKKVDKVVSKETNKVLKQIDPSGQKTKQVKREAGKISDAIGERVDAAVRYGDTTTNNNSGVAAKKLTPTGGIDVSKIKKVCGDPNTKCVR